MIEMAVLVAYASKHGATHEIAERIAQTLTAAGQQAQVRSVSAAGDLAAVRHDHHSLARSTCRQANHST
jgi:menaquinone-dependent protoporphyrinogen IX oxidase